MHLITIKLILCHKPFPWLNSLGFWREPLCDRNSISTYCTCTVLGSRTVRVGGSTRSGGSWAVCSVTRELFVHPTCVHALSRNWWGVNTAKSRAHGKQEFICNYTFYSGASTPLPRSYLDLLKESWKQESIVIKINTNSLFHPLHILWVFLNRPLSVKLIREPFHLNNLTVFLNVPDQVDRFLSLELAQCGSVKK